jgi:hypothetical protein
VKIVRVTGAPLLDTTTTVPSRATLNHASDPVIRTGQRGRT